MVPAKYIVEFNLLIYMKLSDLKDWVNRLPEEELEKDLMYNAIDYGLTGNVGEIRRSDENLYFVGDDPVLLHTKKELKQRGFSDGDISRFDVEIPKGCYYIELNNEYSILERFSY